LTIKQIIALRFASDEEFVRLARRAVNEALNNDEIKKEIKNWKIDTLRV
jgi:AMMECR1 domain-containing protein